MISSTLIAMSLAKLAVAGSLSMSIITGLKWFNTFDPKRKKKGGNKDEVSNEIESLREKVRTRS